LQLRGAVEQTLKQLNLNASLGAGPLNSVLIMSGATQQNWHHALLKQTLKFEPRINLTFSPIA